MRFQQLTEEQTPLFMTCLQDKMVWGNGLVGREDYHYDGRHFICKMSDAREPYLTPYLTKYTEGEFVTFLQKERFPDHVLEALLKKVEGHKRAN